jgi:hypothetical protein
MRTAGERTPRFVVPGFTQPSFGAGAGPIFGFEQANDDAVGDREDRDEEGEVGRGE